MRLGERSERTGSHHDGIEQSECPDPHSTATSQTWRSTIRRSSSVLIPVCIPCHGPTVIAGLCVTKVLGVMLESPHRLLRSVGDLVPRPVPIAQTPGFM